MNHVAIAPSTARLPELSTRLCAFVDARTDADPERRERARLYPPEVTPALAAEAAAAADAYAAALAPATRNALIAWAEPINAAVRNPQNRQDFFVRLSAWAATLANMPAAVFTPETQREALQRFQFFPSSAEVFELLEPEAQRIRAAVKALREIAAPRAGPPPEPHDGPTAEAKAAVREMVRKLKADMANAP